MTKSFTLRVDLESDKGIREGVPRLLDLLKKYDIKASFYLTMGGESNLFELLKYRNPLKSSGERRIKLWSFWEKLRMAFFPRDFVRGNLEVLKRILAEGHELGIHGWKHRAWTRGLDKINARDHIIKSKRKYFRLFGVAPTSFSAPGFNTGQMIRSILSEEGIQVISDLEGGKVSISKGIKNVPMTILGENRGPIIESLVADKKTDPEILKRVRKKIEELELSSFYIHGLFEARFKLDLLEKILRFVVKNRIKNRRIIDY